MTFNLLTVPLTLLDSGIPTRIETVGDDTIQDFYDQP